MNIIITILEYFIMSFVMMTSIIFCWNKLLKKTIDFKDKRLYITLFCLMIISLLNYFNTSVFMRTFIITAFLIIFFRYLFKLDFKTSIITPIYVQLIYMVAETVFVLVICVIFNMGSEEMVTTHSGKILSNVVISLLSVIIACIPFISKIYKYLLNITGKINKGFLIMFCFLIIIVSNLLGLSLYFKMDFKYLLTFNTIVSIIFFLIIIKTFKTQDNYLKVIEKYNTTLNSLREYEEILDRYRVSNHENKNQLLTIRNMVSDKEAKNYIDAIVENKLKDNEHIMQEAAKIPSGGLRGLIYSKMSYMKEKNIEYDLEISKGLRTVDLISKINEQTMLDICKIVGVYLDNAIQAVEGIKEKEREVYIEMYLEDKDFVISITNNYEGKIEINKLEDKGYTTKSKGHGYGLVLAKEIIEKDKKLSNEKIITRDNFTQILRVNL